MNRALAHAADAVRSLRPRTVLVCAWLLMLAYAFPGYMNWDSGDQLFQVRNHNLSDWHPPLMAAYWWIIELVVHGPVGMLLLQISLFLWGLYELLRQRLDDRAAAWIAALLFLYPPIFTPMAAVWKDAQMAGFLAAGLALAVRTTWRARIGGLLLLVLAAGVRDNAAAALPNLMLWIAAAWGSRGWLRKCALGVVLFAVVVFSASFANRQLTDTRDYAWYKTVAIFDIAGTVAHAEPIPDEELRPILDGTGLVVTDDLQARLRKVYSPRVWFQISFSEDAVFVTLPTKSERLARRRALLELMRRYPAPYLAHRWAVTRELLGLTRQPTWEPVCQTFAANEDHLARIDHDHSYSWLQKKLGRFYREKLGQRIFYKPWAYLVLALVFLGYGFWRRDQIVVALSGSALLYETSFVAVTAAPDYRYSHWMVTCTCLCAVLIFVDQLRRGRTRSATIPAFEPELHGERGSDAHDAGDHPVRITEIG